MQALTRKTIAAGLAAFLTLTAVAYAQRGPMKKMPDKAGLTGKRGMTGNGMTGNGMMGNGMMGNGMMKDMMPIHTLLMNHDQITRTVQDIPGGVRTVTTSQDPQTAQTIRTHVWQMKERLAKNEPIRQGDPLFRQIFLHHSEFSLQIQDIAGGVRTTETSRNPQVTLLIRQHARAAVSEFVKYGMPRVMQPTPLPKGYHPRGGKAVDGATGGMMGM